MLRQIKRELDALSNPKKAEVNSRFFKTGKGEYGEGDVFLGLTVPEQRTIAKKYIELNMNDIEKMLYSRIHEHRLTSLLILVEKYTNADIETKKRLVDFYLKNRGQVNNWDLVDLTSDKILGDYLLERERTILYKLAESNNIWDRRISIVSTFEFIRNNQFEDTIKISEMLLGDGHDLIHKAVGWMLREIGKRNQEAEEDFLKKYYKTMPRTMLRYAIEKFDAEKKKFYMGK